MGERPGGAPRPGLRLTDHGRTGLVVLTGFVVGCVTSLAQGRPPGALDAFTNSASAWLILAFFVGRLMRALPGALAAGAATCLAELVGYYLTASVRGLGLGESSTMALWVACALVGGPVLAVAGFWWRSGPTAVRQLAPLVLAACFAVEGARYAVVLDAPSKAMLWLTISLTIALAAAWAAVAEARSTRAQPRAH